MAGIATGTARRGSRFAPYLMIAPALIYEAMECMGGNGYITPNNAMGGGNVSVTINNTVSDQAQATVQPRMNNGKLELEVLIQQVLAKDMQQNGRITQGMANTFGLARAV